MGSREIKGTWSGRSGSGDATKHHARKELRSVEEQCVCEPAEYDKVQKQYTVWPKVMQVASAEVRISSSMCLAGGTLEGGELGAEY